MEVIVQIETLAKIKTCLLLSGPTGSGKSTFAEKIHLQSERKNKKFVRINMASLSSSLIESELFGHEKGAFTGAVFERKSPLETIAGGTLFLDEISELDLSGQKKLLDLIELKTFKRVGGNKEHKFEGTIILATNKCLKTEVTNKNFREDLYYRIRVFEKALSPLRSDPHLLLRILEQTSRQSRLKTYSEEALRYLLAYNWPGNYRELVNSIEYILTVSNQSVLSVDDLPPWIKEFGQESVKDNYKNALDKFEKRLITDKLKLNLGKINETAKVLEISKTTLIQKIRKYQIEVNCLKELPI